MTKVSMIGNELWDRSIFGGAMILIGTVFTWLVWDKSFVLAAVGIINVLFGAYVIWGAIAWEEYKKYIHRKFSKGEEKRKEKNL